MCFILAKKNSNREMRTKSFLSAQLLVTFLLLLRYSFYLSPALSFTFFNSPFPIVIRRCWSLRSVRFFSPLRLCSLRLFRRFSYARIRTIHSNTRKRNSEVIKNNLSSGYVGIFLVFRLFGKSICIVCIRFDFSDAYDAVQSGIRTQ